MKKLLVLSIALLWMVGCGTEPASDFDMDLPMVANQTEIMSAVGTDIVAAKSALDQEWVDSWTADGGGWVWYTPEDYVFATGDTVELVVFYVPGSYWNLSRIDAFYQCGETNWRNFLMSNVTDFGTLPPPPPDYGWITGIGYIAPSMSLEVDWASRCDMTGYQLPCGVPLGGRPDCFMLN